MMGPTIPDILLGILPMVLLLGVFYIVMRKFIGRGSLIDRQVKALERIADALEKRQ